MTDMMFSPLSLRRDTGGLYYPGPLRDLFDDVLCRLLRCVADRIRPLIDELLPGIRGIQRLDDLAMKIVDDRARRLGLCRKAVPGRDLESRYAALGDRRVVGRRARAFRARHR